MTSKQELNSPAVTRLFSTGRVRPRVATEEVLEAINQKPVPTVWGQRQARPIYDRLPSVEEQYQKGYDEGQNYVYIDPQLGKYEGPGSMQPKVAIGNPSVITVESGIATWKMGQVITPAGSFNVADYARYGLDNGTFKIGYVLSFEVPESDSPIPGHSLAEVVQESLAEAAIVVAANKEVEDHEDYNAISTAVDNSSWWPAKDLAADEYCDGTWLALDFRTPITAQTFELVADKAYFPTSDVAAFYSDDGGVWTKAAQSYPIGESWVLDVSAYSETPHRYWRFYFWDGDASVADISYTGSAYYPDLRLTRPVQQATLHVENLYDDPPENFLLVAQFKVKDREITKVADYRTFTGRKYEPLASWLTAFQDVGLRGMFTAVENYNQLYMDPTTADYQFYRELDNTDWFGVGQFSVGEEADTYSPAKAVDATEDLNPSQVICLLDPQEPSDLSTKVYTDSLFENLPIDNGLYF